MIFLLKIFLSSVKFLLVVVPGLVSVAFLTLLERKVLRIVGFRLGPNKVSFLGFLQPVRDALKLRNKSLNYLSNFSFLFYYISSCFMFSISVFVYSSLFSSPSPTFLKYRLIFFFIFLAFNSLNSILTGWRTFSKFSLIGSIRTVSQLISYEVSLYLCFFFLVRFFGSFDRGFFFKREKVFFAILILPCLYIWVPSVLAELNRTPFDFSEGERELVRGFNTEFGSSCFTLIFLAEYGIIIFFCLISSFFFSSGLFFFVCFVLSVLWFRSVLPRFRFDKLMYLAWKFFLPFLTLFFVYFYVTFSF